MEGLSAMVRGKGEVRARPTVIGRVYHRGGVWKQGQTQKGTASAQMRKAVVLGMEGKEQMQGTLRTGLKGLMRCSEEEGAEEPSEVLLLGAQEIIGELR